MSFGLSVSLEIIFGRKSALLRLYKMTAKARVGSLYGELINHTILNSFCLF